MAVRADQRVRIGDLDGLLAFLDLRGPDGLREILEIHLMADARAGRHHAEIVEGRLAPAQERVALAIAFELARDVLLEGVLRAEVVHHHRVVDDEVDRRQRVDLLGVTAQRRHGVAHRGEVNDGRNAREVLHEHAGRAEGDLAVRAALLQPVGAGLDVSLRDRAVVFVTQQVLEQHLHRVGQLRYPVEAVLLGGLEAVVGIGLGADFECLLALETVEGGHGR